MKYSPIRINIPILLLAISLLCPWASFAGERENVVTQPHDEWALGGGFVYWAYHCADSSECDPDPFLRRMPILGGDITTMATIPGGAYSFMSLSADSDGAYVYDDVEGHVEFYATTTPTADPLVLRHTGIPPTTRFVSDATHIYWGSSSGVHRAAKNGSGGGQIFSVSDGVNDLALNDQALYYSNDTGLFRYPRCGAWPTGCFPTTISDLPASFVLLIDTEIYWVAEISGHDAIMIEASAGGVASIYNAPPSTTINRLASDGSNLFWIQSTSDENILYHMDLATLQENPIDSQSDPGYVLPVDPRIAVDDYYVYYRLIERPLQKLPLDAPPMSRDIAVNSMVEITQGIQSLDVDVPLVAGKDVWVRAWGRTAEGPSTGFVEAELSLVRDGVVVTEGRPFTPINGTQYLASGPEEVPDRHSAQSGWLFHVPGFWTEAGDVVFRVLVDPRQAIVDDDRANNGVQKGVTFVNRPPSCMVFIPVNTHAPTPSLDDPNTGAMWERYTALWPTKELKRYSQAEPIEELEICFAGGWFPYPCFGPYELPDDGAWVIASLVTRDTFSDDPDACDDAGTRTQYIGMVHPNTNSNDKGGRATVLGEGNLCLAAAWVKFPPHDVPTPENQEDSMWPLAGSTLAHEGAHNFHRRHVSCGDPMPADNDPSYPYGSCSLSFDDSSQSRTHFGFDRRSREPISNTEAADLMSYRASRWISDWTYKYLFAAVDDFSVFDCVWDEICGPHDGYEIDCPWQKTKSDLMDGDAASPWAWEIESASEIVLLNGIIGPNDRTGRLNTAWVYPSARASEGLLRKWGRKATPKNSDAPQRSGINYTVRIVDPRGVVLDERAIVPREAARPTATDYQAVFDITFPKPSGIVKHLQLLADGVILDEISPGASIPSAHILVPAGGETFSNTMSITWSASDADPDDTLLTTIQYSADGGHSWTVVADSIPVRPGEDETTRYIDLKHGISGTESAGLIRIIVSDGFNTDVDTSAAFTVTNRKPSVVINEPLEAQSNAPGQAIIARGEAMDEEDGDLHGTSLQWSVDGSSAGSGNEIVIDGLKPGIHNLELFATDFSSDLSYAKTTFDISALEIPFRAEEPILDGICHDGPWAHAHSIGIEPYGDGYRATAHLLRSSDALWICITGLKRGSGVTTSYAGLRIDTDNSRDALAQSDDYSFFVNEDGTIRTRSGNGAGGFSGSGPGGLTARISATDSVWSTEMRIDASVIYGLDHAMGLNVGHYWVDSQGDDYNWPFAAVWNNPSTWAATALGKVPEIDTISPTVVTTNSGSVNLSIVGDHFASDAIMYLDGSARSTIRVSEQILIGTAEAGDVVTTGCREIVVANTGFEGTPSNSAFFCVENPEPEILSLFPGSIAAGKPGFTLEVRGGNFVHGAVVSWNGVPRTTTFVTAGRLHIDVSAAEIEDGRDVAVQVMNPDPSGAPSNVVYFHVVGTVSEIFADGFESGNTSVWSVAVH